MELGTPPWAGTEWLQAAYPDWMKLVFKDSQAREILFMTPNQKYYVNKNDTIIVRCLACKKTRSISVAGLRGKQHTLKVQCLCTNTFAVDIEFRRSYRKDVYIAGGYRKRHEQETEERSCVVQDLSVGGLGIRIEHDTSVQVEDELIVTFRLDERQKRRINTAVKVRHVDPNKKIGGEFIDQDDPARDEVLTFYL